MFAVFSTLRFRHYDFGITMAHRWLLSAALVALALSEAAGYPAGMSANDAFVHAVRRLLLRLLQTVQLLNAHRSRSLLTCPAFSLSGANPRWPRTTRAR